MRLTSPPKKSSVDEPEVARQLDRVGRVRGGEVADGPTRVRRGCRDADRRGLRHRRRSARRQRPTSRRGRPTSRRGRSTPPPGLPGGPGRRPRSAAARRSACAGATPRRAPSRPTSPESPHLARLAGGRSRILPARGPAERRRRHRERREPERLAQLLVRHRRPRRCVVPVAATGMWQEPRQGVRHGAERPDPGPALSRPGGVGWLEEITVGHRTRTVAQHRSNRRRQAGLRGRTCPTLSTQGID